MGAALISLAWMTEIALALYMQESSCNDSIISAYCFFFVLLQPVLGALSF